VARSRPGPGSCAGPQPASPFRYSGLPAFKRDAGDAEYRKFVAATGIELEPNCGINTSQYENDWHSVSPRVEIIQTDFTDHAVTAAFPAAIGKRQGQLALLNR
jgi:hypothetical protein